MTLFQLAVLAVIQGITEFLPISSSGHLVLLPALTGWQDQGLALDVAVHVGTLVAVMLYAWRDIWIMIRDLVLLFRGKTGPGLRLIGLLILATLPVVGAGYLVHHYLGEMPRMVEVVAWSTLGFGLLLGLADKIGVTLFRQEHLGWGSALAIGFAQCLALIPGASRAGVTMTAARFLGYERQAAARFSMLLAIPAILGAGVLKGKDLIETGDPILTEQALIAAGMACVAALIAILLMMAWLKRASFTPFVWYRVFLGGALLAWVYWGDTAPIVPLVEELLGRF